MKTVQEKTFNLCLSENELEALAASLDELSTASVTVGNNPALLFAMASEFALKHPDKIQDVFNLVGNFTTINRVLLVDHRPLNSIVCKAQKLLETE